MNTEAVQSSSPVRAVSQKTAGEIAFLTYCKSRGLEPREGEPLPAYEDLQQGLRPTAKAASLGAALRQMLF